MVEIAKIRFEYLTLSSKSSFIGKLYFVSLAKQNRNTEKCSKCKVRKHDKLRGNLSQH